jgi:far upstream element-binding protein
MADDRYSSKRKYDDPSPPPRRTGFSSGPPPASPPAGGALSYSSVPPPPDEIQLAKQRAQEIAARLFNAAEVKRPRFDNVDDDVGIGGGSFGGGGRSGAGGLGFSSSAGGGHGFSSSGGSHGFSSSGGGGERIGFFVKPMSDGEIFLLGHRAPDCSHEVDLE